MPLGDNLIRKTSDTGRTNKTSKANKTSKTSKVSNTNITSKVIGQPSRDPEADTFNTKKMTFYVKESLLEALYNFAYWDRYTVTEAVNKALEDGLKGKNTKPRPKK